jgi:hypothetical protein
MWPKFGHIGNLSKRVGNKNKLILKTVSKVWLYWQPVQKGERQQIN